MRSSPPISHCRSVEAGPPMGFVVTLIRRCCKGMGLGDVTPFPELQGWKFTTRIRIELSAIIPVLVGFMCVLCCVRCRVDRSE